MTAPANWFTFVGLDHELGGCANVQFLYHVTAGIPDGLWLLTD